MRGTWPQSCVASPLANIDPTCSYALIRDSMWYRGSPQRWRTRRNAPTHRWRPSGKFTHRVNSAPLSTRAAKSKMASNKLRVQRDWQMKVYVAFTGRLGHRRAPGGPLGQREDVFRIKRPYVAVITRHHFAVPHMPLHTISSESWNVLTYLQITQIISINRVIFFHSVYVTGLGFLQGNPETRRKISAQVLISIQ